jgi:hypothetical protein
MDPTIYNPKSSKETSTFDIDLIWEDFELHQLVGEGATCSHGIY